MRNVPALSFTLWLCLLISTSMRVHAEPGPESIKVGDFLTKYRSALREHQETYRNARIDGFEDVTRTKSDSSEGATHTAPTLEFYFVSSDGNERARLRKDKPRYFDRVVAHAGNERFCVRRTSASGSYFIERVNDSEQNWRKLDIYRIHLKNAPYWPGGCPDFPEIVNSPDFKIQEVIPIHENERTSYKVSFQYLPAEQAKAKIEGWIALDAASNLVIRSFEFDAREPMENKTTILVHYVGSTAYTFENGRAIPKEIQFSHTYNKKNSNNFRYNISRFVLEPTPPEEFTLAAFGLGDVAKGISEIKRRDFYWKMAGVLTTLSIGLALFWIGRTVQKSRADKRDIGKSSPITRNHSG